MFGMRPLRNFKPNRCYHLISWIANRTFFLTDRERTRFVDRLWRVAKFSGIEVKEGRFVNYSTTFTPPLGTFLCPPLCHAHNHPSNLSPLNAPLTAR